MLKRFLPLIALMIIAAPLTQARADDYSDTIRLFRNAGESGSFVKHAYGYAVFPTIGKAGVGVGGAFGKGRVYAKEKHVGEASVVQVSVGFQLGAQGYSEIICFEDERAFKDFTSGNFEFGADASAVAITAAASASASTTGSSLGVSGGKNDARTVGEYHKGMATFTIVKGGLMYQATIGGQKFSYTPL